MTRPFFSRAFYVGAVSAEFNLFYFTCEDDLSDDKADTCDYCGLHDEFVCLPVPP